MSPRAPLRVVGRSVPRLDALDKVTGRARYVTDLERPGMLHAKLLRSPYPHARIVHVEVTRARAQAGVHTVVTGTDFGWCDPYFGPAFRDRPILAIDVARYEGEPVAAVVADDEEAAAEALELIEIEYEEIPAVTTLEEALAPGAALVHTSEPLAGYFADLATLKPKRGTNICHQFHLERVAGAAAFAEADVVVDDVYRFPRVQHYSMEPHAALADWDEDGGSPYGPPRRIPIPCGSSSPGCSACPSAASASSFLRSGVASAVRPTRSSSRSWERSPGWRSGRSAWR